MSSTKTFMPAIVSGVALLVGQGAMTALMATGVLHAPVDQPVKQVDPPSQTEQAPTEEGQGIGVGKAIVRFEESPLALVERLQREGYECHVNRYGGGERKGQVSTAGCELLPDDQDAQVQFRVGDDGSLEEINISSFSDSTIHQAHARLVATLGEPVNSKEIEEYGSPVRVEQFEAGPHRATVHTRLSGEGPDVSLTVAIQRGQTIAPAVAPPPGPGDADPSTGRIIGPAWVICVTASTDKADTLAKAKELRGKGFDSDVLWIPDYGSMSGAESWLAFVGPVAYGDRPEAEKLLDRVQQTEPKSYALKLDNKGPREAFH